MLWRIGYLILLGRLMVGLWALPPSPLFPLQDDWDRTVVSTFLGREMALQAWRVYGQAQWRLRRWWLWWLRQKARRQAPNPHACPSAQRLAERLFPEQPPDYFTWGEVLALEGLKRQWQGLWQLIPESVCVGIFLKVRWAQGLRCPYCGGTQVRVKDPHYRGHFRRYRCLECSRALGREVTFCDLTGTLLEASPLSVRAWLWAMMLYVQGQSAEAISKELGVNRKTGQRLRRLFQTAHFTQRFAQALKGPVEIDEIYVISGLKGHPAGQTPNHPARKRGLKRKGRGSWQGDKPPVLGLVDRKGQVYLIVLANVQGPTIRPFIERLVAQGATVHTDEYGIYSFLHKAGFLHHSVCHSQGEYARGEVHINTCEGLWAWVRTALRPYRGVSKVYLPLYVAALEFRHNRRGQSRWDTMVDLLVLTVKADGSLLRRQVRQGTVSQLCPIPGLAA